MAGTLPSMSDLCRIVFSTPDGRRLLEMLDAYYVRAPIAHESPFETFRMLGKRDLIVELERKTNFTMVAKQRA